MIVSMDVGGTFTDILVLDEGLRRLKIPSTPDDPAEAVIRGFPLGADTFIHGTTVATNAFLEGKGVRTAFITNQNFEDILFIGRQVRPKLYDLHIDKPEPPLLTEDCYGIPGRMDSNGDVICDTDPQRIREMALSLKKKGCSAAVCFLHSYKNSDHEEMVGRILDSHGISHSLSHRVSNEFREYERGITTLLDAYIGPVVRNYFKRIRDRTGIDPLVMKSSGDLELSSRINPIDTFYSGPAGGAAGGEYISKILGIGNLITLDMGGTSADMATVLKGKMGWKDQALVGAFPVQSRMADIVTVGAGGGSVAWVDQGNMLRVGPRSAGASPGPACYGHGGIEPTLTDALLLAGYIDQDYFLGGEMKLQRDRAEKALRIISNSLGLPMDETIMGVIRVANSTMARCMKSITVERGLMPDRFSILAFGGAGPLHAPYLAEELGIERVYVPPMPGVFSAFGMLTGDIVREKVRTVLILVEEKEALANVIEELSLGQEGERTVYLGARYHGQSHHLNIPLSEDMETDFHDAHRALYGYSHPDEVIEIVNVRVQHRLKRAPPVIDLQDEPGEHPPARMCLFPEGEMESMVYYRKHMLTGEEGKGPAVIEDMDSTILIPPGWGFRVARKSILELVRT